MKRQLAGETWPQLVRRRCQDDSAEHTDLDGPAAEPSVMDCSSGAPHLSKEKEEEEEEEEELCRAVRAFEAKQKAEAAAQAAKVKAAEVSVLCREVHGESQPAHVVTAADQPSGPPQVTESVYAEWICKLRLILEGEYPTSQAKAAAAISYVLTVTPGESASW